MVKVTFTDRAGQSTSVDAGAGASLMEAAVEHEIAGIEAQCYGAGVCGTCHVYVGDNWLDATGEKSAWEQDMLDALPLARPNSRLSCQIVVCGSVDGAQFFLPERQESLE